MEVFPWPTTANCSFNRAPRTLETPFGEYVQRIKNGINADMKAGTVEFSELAPETCDAIEAFLAARGAAEAFLWAAPRETVVRKWICKTWSSKPQQDKVKWTITAEFKEVSA